MISVEKEFNQFYQILLIIEFEFGNVHCNAPNSIICKLKRWLNDARRWTYFYCRNTFLTGSFIKVEFLFTLVSQRISVVVTLDAVMQGTAKEEHTHFNASIHIAHKFTPAFEK